MSEINFIYWEQAVRYDKVTEIANEYRALVYAHYKELLSNPLLNINQEIFQRYTEKSIRLLDAYHAGYYSDFLFNETKVFLDEIAANEEINNTIRLKSAFSIVAEKLTNIVKQNISNEKDNRNNPESNNQ